MKYISTFLSIVVCFIFAFPLDLSSQIKPIRSDKVDPGNVYTSLLEKLYYERIQNMRQENDLDTLMRHQVFNKASKLQTKWMKKNNRASIKQTDNEDMATTQKRLASLGGKKDADVAEIAVYGSIGRGRQYYSYQKVVDDMIESVMRSRSNKALIKNPDYLFTGIDVKYNKERERVYLSQTFGSANSLNLGPKYKDELKVPYDDDEQNLNAYLKEKCGDIKRFYDWSGLHSGLFVENNEQKML